MGSETVQLDGPARLIALFDGRERLLDGHRVVLGSASDCDIHVAGAEVAPRHAIIVTLPDHAYVEDLGAEVGTYVNGRRVMDRERLHNGDCMAVGCHEFQYLCGAKLAEHEDHLAGLAAGTRDARGLAPRSGLKFGRLTVLTGPARGRGFDITKSKVTVGRPRGEVAVIRRDRAGFFLSAGVRSPVPAINGEAPGGPNRLLHDGDVIEMAGVELEFVEIF